VIPASGYYEWQPTPTGKQPYCVTAADGAVLSFAGLSDQWHNAETGERVASCTTIVTSANDVTRAIHDPRPHAGGTRRAGQSMLGSLARWVPSCSGR
jgi:putative SOS response-associated peptidase YedK